MPEEIPEKIAKEARRLHRAVEKSYYNRKTESLESRPENEAKFLLFCLKNNVSPEDPANKITPQERETITSGNEPLATRFLELSAKGRMVALNIEYLRTGYYLNSIRGISLIDKDVRMDIIQQLAADRLTRRDLLKLGVTKSELESVASGKHTMSRELSRLRTELSKVPRSDGIKRGLILSKIEFFAPAENYFKRRKKMTRAPNKRRPGKP
ncbi:MAG: hypothetical protein ABID38_01410 [Candidatus Diapherotrites archaeon]